MDMASDSKGSVLTRNPLSHDFYLPDVQPLELSDLSYMARFETPNSLLAGKKWDPFLRKIKNFPFVRIGNLPEIALSLYSSSVAGSVLLCDGSSCITSSGLCLCNSA